MGSKILLADDSITIQKVVNLTFVDEGIEVITVSNGEMAQRRLAEVNPDLVLADIFMPGKNGYELCQFVKDSPQFKDVPVVLLVGAFEPFDQAEARRVKADGHLTKPFESRTLVETVRNLIQVSKARRPSRPLTPPPVAAAVSEPPVQDFSELISEPFDSTPTTRPLEMPFHLQEPDFSADSAVASDAEGGHQTGQYSASTTIPFLPLELDGINEPVQANGHGYADPNAPLSLDIPDVEYSAPAEPYAGESRASVPAFIDHPVSEPVSETVSLGFEAVEHQDQPPMRPAHPMERTTPVFDPSVELTGDLDGPGERDFAFEPAHFGGPEADIAPAAEPTGFGFEISESGPPQSAVVEDSVHSAKISPPMPNWQSAGPSVHSEAADQNFEVFEEQGAPSAPPVAVHQVDDVNEPAVALAGFAAEDDPLGDILEGGDTATESTYAEHEALATEVPVVVAAQELAAEAPSYSFGFDLVTPVQDSTAQHPAEAESASAVEHGSADGQAQHHGESPLAAIDIHADHPEPAPTEHHHEYWGEQPGSVLAEAQHPSPVFVETQHLSNESSFDVVSVEPGEPPAAPAAPPHADFFISSFPASQRAEFTSADLWAEPQVEEPIPAPAAPASSAKETSSAPADAGSWLGHQAQQSPLASETGFEFSDLVDEVEQEAATPEGQRVNGADLSVATTPAAAVPPVVEIAHDAELPPVAEAHPAVAQASAPEQQEAEPLPVAPAVAATEPTTDVRAGHAGVPERTNGSVPDLSRAVIDEIVRRVVLELTDAVVREIAWEVVPECVERVVEKLSREGVSKTA
ncbi:MAG TPA: response regulator [Blastocatellia bacterium]